MLLLGAANYPYYHMLYTHSSLKVWQNPKNNIENEKFDKGWWNNLIFELHIDSVPPYLLVKDEIYAIVTIKWWIPTPA